ncbi:hypothetical protein BIY22_14865 [Vibrio panuliri]|nr:hypothetical protein BIY22_14865 [Vibrio panuliri]
MDTINAALENMQQSDSACRVNRQVLDYPDAKLSLTSFNFGTFSTVFIEGKIDQAFTIPIQNNHEFLSLSFVVNGQITTTSHQYDFKNIATSGSAHFCSHRFFSGQELYDVCEQLKVVFICFKQGFIPEFDTLYTHSKALEQFGFQHMHIHASHPIQDCVNLLFSPLTSEALLPMYIQGKSYELLALCAQSLFSEIPRKTGISDTALNRVHQARDILERQLLHPPKIHDLAHLVGTNECSLKKEFKAVFDTSPYAYVIQRRMEKAYRQILTSDLPITTIAQNHGYNNTSHFASTFFKYFGIRPRGLKQLRKNPTSHLQAK